MTDKIVFKTFFVVNFHSYIFITFQFHYVLYSNSICIVNPNFDGIRNERVPKSFVPIFSIRSNIICGGFNDWLSTKVSGQIASKTTKADRKNSQSLRIINLRNKWKSADICYTRLEKMAAIVDSCHVIRDGIN